MNSKLTPLIFSELNHQNDKRHVGFELEYFGISIETTANLLQSLYGGKINKHHKNLTRLSDTQLGSFEIELDAQPLKNLAKKSQQNQNENHFDWEGMVEKILSKTAHGMIPIEIKTPPVLIQDIPLLDEIIIKLRETDAYDTKESLLTAFGLHINPDVPSLNPLTLLAFMQSFVLLNDYIKQKMPLDISRKYSGFIKDYSKSYCEKILREDYKPDLEALIQAYLHENASRNRALDMLPLFAFLRGDLVKGKYDIKKVNPRPTFHYRLANSHFSEADWNFSKEWQRWLYIEALAKDDLLRQAMAKDYLTMRRANWIRKIEDYIAK